MHLRKSSAKGKRGSFLPCFCMPDALFCLLDSFSSHAHTASVVRRSSNLFNRAFRASSSFRSFRHSRHSHRHGLWPSLLASPLTGQKGDLCVQVLFQHQQNKRSLTHIFFEVIPFVIEAAVRSCSFAECFIFKGS